MLAFRIAQINNSTRFSRAFHNELDESGVWVSNAEKSRWASW
jgi:hypothetical protein